MAFSDIINRELLSAALGQFKTKLATVFAPLASPAMTGAPTAPTAEAGTNTQQIATTAFVKTAVDAEASRADEAIADKNVTVFTVSGMQGLPVNVIDPRITADMVVVNAVLSNPAAQLCDWTVTPANGSLTIAKVGEKTGIGYSGTDITLYMQHTGSETSQTSRIKQRIVSPPAGWYYTRNFTPADEDSIFSSIVSSGTIRVHRSGTNISVRLMDFTFSSILANNVTYTIATLPENCRLMLMQQGQFICDNAQYHGLITIAAGTGEVSIGVRGTDIPAGTLVPMYMPVFNVARDHDDQDMDGYTLTIPNS